MSENFEKLPENIQDHIRRIAAASEVEDRQAHEEALAAGWLEKMDCFEKETEMVEMEQAESFALDNPNGVLIMTYSGSLINIGPLGEEGRRVEYNSIGMRTDVPEKAEQENCELATDIEVDESVEFASGPIKQSSAVYAIAIMRDELALEEQEDRLAEVTQVLADDFLQVNKTVISQIGQEAEVPSLI